MTSPPEKFTAAEYEYLAGNRLGRIATTSARGVPDLAAVAYVMDGEDVIVGGKDLTKTIKYFNVRDTGLACFSVDDLKTVDPWYPRGVKVRGPARVEEAGDHLTQARNRLWAGGLLVIRVEVATIWSWHLNEGAPKRFHNTERRDLRLAPLGAEEGRSHQ
jgi:pyridoxamine 5'-phosphate oxidase family protein